MATTLSDLRTQVARDLRDTSNNVWVTAELDDLINAAIDEIGDLAPKEVIDYSLTITSGVFTYALPSSLSRVFRVDIHNSSDSYQYQYPQAIGDTASGWEVHNAIVFLSPLHIPATSSKLRIWGYGPFTQISVASATTDLDQRRIWALRAYCKAEAFYALLMDRAKFQQWQTDQTNSDVSLNQLAIDANLAQRQWQRARARLRAMRK